MPAQSMPAVWTVPVTIHTVNPDGTTGTLLTQRGQVNLQIRRHTEWSVTWSMPAVATTDEELEAALVPRLARVRVGLQIGDDSATLFDAVVRRRQRVIVSPNDEAGERWTFTAYDVGTDYAKRRVKVYPAGLIYEPVGGTGANARKGWEPFEGVRTFGWPDPSFDFAAKGATAAVELYQQANPLPFPYGRSGAPFGWLDNDAWWIWDRALADLAHPAGTIYGHKQFTLAEPRKLIIDSAGDDAYELWLNGVLIAARAKAEDGSTWTRLARTEVMVGPGNHTLRFSCTNEGGNTGNIGGFICSVYDQLTGNVLCHTDSSWSVIGYPTEIGQTPAEILAILLQVDPQYRGFTTGWPIPGFTFTPTHDSAGRPLPIIPKWPVEVGKPVQEAVDRLAATYIEYQWHSGNPYYGVGHALSIWSAEGVTVAGGGTAPDPTTNYAYGRLQAGVEGNVTEITADEDLENLYTHLLYMWGGGHSEMTPTLAGSDAAAATLAALGRHEGFLPIGDVDDPDPAYQTARQNLLASCEPKPTVTAKLSAGAGRFRPDVPMLHYWLHHNVECPNIDDPDTYDWLRLVGLTATDNDETGYVELVPNYATRAELWIERIQRWLERQTLNPQNGLTDAASPASPSVISTTVIEAQHQTFSGDVATEGAVATPWQPTETVVVTQGLSRSEEAGSGTTQLVVTIDGFPTSPSRQVNLNPGEKAGFAQFNEPALVVVAPPQGLNVVVTTNGGHQHVSVDLFYAPYPFGS